jgi:hypothetical protein
METVPAIRWNDQRSQHRGPRPHLVAFSGAPARVYAIAIRRRTANGVTSLPRDAPCLPNSRWTRGCAADLSPGLTGSTADVRSAVGVLCTAISGRLGREALPESVAIIACIAGVAFGVGRAPLRLRQAGRAAWDACEIVRAVGNGLLRAAAISIAGVRGQGRAGATRPTRRPARDIAPCHCAHAGLATLARVGGVLHTVRIRCSADRASRDATAGFAHHARSTARAVIAGRTPRCHARIRQACLAQVALIYGTARIHGPADIARLRALPASADLGGATRSTVRIRPRCGARLRLAGLTPGARVRRSRRVKNAADETAFATGSPVTDHPRAAKHSGGGHPC